VYFASVRTDGEHALKAIRDSALKNVRHRPAPFRLVVRPAMACGCGTGLVSHHRAMTLEVWRYYMSNILEVDHEDGQCASSKPRLL